MPAEEWICPRCGLIGDSLQTPDPGRCKHCCAADVALELVEALRTLLHPPSDHPIDAIWVDGNYEPADPCDPPAVRWYLTPRDVATAKARRVLAAAEGRA